jgi:serine phosphatase RsbU (regulator of sigma subunit)
MDKQLLAQVPIFEDLPEDEINYLAENLQVLEVEPDTLLIREGDHGDHFYVIIDGEVEIIKAMGSPEERFISTRGPGEFIGEISLISSKGLRTASVRSKKPTRVWVMTRQDFDDLLHRRPMLAYKMVQVLGMRLTSAHNQAIKDIEEKNIQLQAAYDELKAAQAQIIVKERLEKELQVAYDIQMSILPHELPICPGGEFGARIIPARAVGGDFYDIIQRKSDRYSILIGDVTDKGVPSAIFMARAHALLYAEAYRSPSPSAVLQRVNEHLIELGESRLFITVLYGIFNQNNGQFDYARAGHSTPLLGLNNGEVIELPWKLGQPIGIFDKPILDIYSISIPPGGTLLFYTDGITDCRNPQGEMFGTERLKAALKENLKQSAQSVCDNIVQTLNIFQGSAEQDDDVTLVTVKRYI